MSVTHKKKEKKSILKKIGEKLGKKESTDDLIEETLTELKDIVSSMKDVFEEFDESYTETLKQKRGTLGKLKSTLPSFMKPDEIKREEKRLQKIRRNKSTLAALEDSIAKLDIALRTSRKNYEEIGDAYLNLVKMEAGGKEDEAIKKVEERMNQLEGNIAEAMSQLTAQIGLIKNSLDNMAGQLEEQGVIIKGIDEKVDVLDSKLDKAQQLIKEVSRKITGNRVIILIAITAISTVILSGMIK